MFGKSPIQSDWNTGNLSIEVRRLQLALQLAAGRAEEQFRGEERAERQVNLRTTEMAGQ